MLFKANISNSLIDNTDSLVLQLYVFLNEFVRTRMKYESKETVEDCVQETIMYLLKRADSLPRPLDEEFNIEQFFYNRANSFVSMWLRRLINSRKQFKKYKGELEHIAKLEIHEEPLYVDNKLLNKIINQLILATADMKVVRVLSNAKLTELGYLAEEPDIDDIEIYTDTPLDTISYNVVDSYLTQDNKQKD